MSSPMHYLPCEGLHGSGCVLAMVKANALLTSYVNDSNMISLSVPGRPCDALLVFSDAGAAELIEQLNSRLVELRERVQRGRTEELGQQG